MTIHLWQHSFSFSEKWFQVFLVQSPSCPTAFFSSFHPIQLSVASSVVSSYKYDDTYTIMFYIQFKYDETYIIIFYIQFKYKHTFLLGADNNWSGLHSRHFLHLLLPHHPCPLSRQGQSIFLRTWTIFWKAEAFRDNFKCQSNFELISGTRLHVTYLKQI